MNYCAGKKFDRAIKMPLRVYSTIENGEKKKYFELRVVGIKQKSIKLFFPQCFWSVHSSAILLHEQRSMFHISHFSFYWQKNINATLSIRLSCVRMHFPFVDRLFIAPRRNSFCSLTTIQNKWFRYAIECSSVHLRLKLMKIVCVDLLQRI